MRTNLSSRIYRRLLIAYPYEFRHEYGIHMVQVFQDRYRDEVSRNKLALLGYWFSTLVDLVVTAMKEHGENFGKDRRLMNNLRRDAIALVGTIVIIVVALVFHRWIVVSGRSGGASPIFFFGFALDAVVTTGIVGNLIVFLLVKATKWDSLRIALWTFLIIHVAFVTIIAILGPRLGPPFSLGPVIIGYVVSFVFWFGLHWAWRSMRPEVASS